MSAKVVAAVLLHAILVVGSTRNLNRTHGNITKRTFLPPPPPYETVNYKLCEGHRLSELLFASEADNGEQRGSTISKDWKPDRVVTADSNTLTSNLGFLDGVKGVVGYATRKPTWKVVRIFLEQPNGEAWRDTTCRQTKEDVRHGFWYGPNHAYIRALTSGVSRVLAIVKYESPEEASGIFGSRKEHSSAQSPQLQRLSDIAFALYMQGIRRGGAISRPPTWFLLKGFEDSSRYREDLGTISWCLLTHNLELQSWPGITFPIGTPCFYAILATYPSSEIAEMLISHKKDLSAASLASVTVFAEGDSVSFLCFGGALDLERLEQAEEKNKEYVNYNLGGVTFPVPLNPRKAWESITGRPIKGKPAAEASE